MIEKMTFWEKLAYRFGKDPLKVSKGHSPLSQAVRNNDFERLDFFAKHSKLDSEKLATETFSDITSIKTFKKLQEMGAKFNDTQKAGVVKTILNNLLNRRNRTYIEPETLDFLRTNNVSLNFKNKNGKSIYDNISNVSLWLEKATPKEIAHELRQAVANGQVSKVKRMLVEYDQFVAKTPKDNELFINAQNSQGKTALMYAIGTNNIEMARFLYEHGADTTMKDKSGNSIFASNPKMASAMMEIFARADDLEALKVAAQNGGKFDNPNLALLAQKEETLKYLASHGAPLQDAMRDADNADLRENTMGGKAAERVAMLARVKASTKPSESKAFPEEVAKLNAIMQSKISTK